MTRHFSQLFSYVLFGAVFGAAQVASAGSSTAATESSGSTPPAPIIVAPYTQPAALDDSSAQQSHASVYNAGIAAQSNQSVPTIGIGDLLDIVVSDAPELTVRVRVSESGIVSLPLVGDVRVAGLTVKQAQESLARLLVAGDLVRHPLVSILVEQFATQGTKILGEVAQPGVYPLLGPHRLLDSISAAGGLSPKAGHSVTILREGSESKQIKIELPSDLKTLEDNVVIYPGDTVIVSKAGVVYVVGDLNRPGAFLMENNTTVTLLQAIALAQGTTKTASLSRAVIIRRDAAGPKEIPAGLDRVLKAKAPDQNLQPDDIVFVPTSQAKNYTYRGIEAIVQAATGMAIYATIPR